MGRFDWSLAFCLLAFAAPAVRAVEPLSASETLGVDSNPFGFHYDKTQDRYFFDGKKTFNIDRGALDRNKARVEVSLDDEAFVPFNSPVDFRIEGRHSIKYRVVNLLNQVLFQKEFTFYLDTSPPESTVQKPTSVLDLNGVHFLSEARGVAISTYDGLSGVRSVEISSDQKNFVPYSPSEPLVQPGKHTFYFRSTDNVGNVSPVKSFTYVLSSEPPKTILKVDPPAAGDKETYIGVGSLLSFAWDNPPVPVREVAVSVDGDRFVYNKPFRVGTPGSHTVKFWAVDYAGNVEREQTFRFSTDDSPPRTVAKLDGRVVDYGNVKFVGKDFRLSLTPTDQGSGVGAIQYRVGESTDRWLTYTDSIKVERDGPHYFWFRSIDKVGNREEAQRIAVIADVTPPKSQLLPGVPFSKIDNKLYSTFPNVLMFKAEDNMSGLEAIYVSINDGPAQVATAGIPLENTFENKIVFKAVDRLGNEENPHTMVVHLSKPDVNVKLVAGSPADGVRPPELKEPKKKDPPKRRIANEEKGD